MFSPELGRVISGINSCLVILENLVYLISFRKSCVPRKNYTFELHQTEDSKCSLEMHQIRNHISNPIYSRISLHDTSKNPKISIHNYNWIYTNKPPNRDCPFTNVHPSMIIKFFLKKGGHQQDNKLKTQQNANHNLGEKKKKTKKENLRTNKNPIRHTKSSISYYILIPYFLLYLLK